MLALFFSYIFLPFILIIHARTLPNYTITPQNIISSTLNNHNNYTWHEFKRLDHATKGSSTTGISKLKKYFHKFGYLEADELTNSTDAYDSNLELAIAKYQHKLGLTVTKKLDSETLASITSPRCGVSDNMSSSTKATERYAYFTGQPRWARPTPMTLTYAFSPENTIASLSNADLRGAFRRAFGHWANVIPVTFVESDDYGFADIRIGFYRGDHGDGEAFDGVLGVLAHAFSPESGRLHLDAAETWAVDFGAEGAAEAVDLESVAAHEIGHLLGLAHTDVKEAVMYPSLKPRERKVELKVDDIRGVQALYGTNPNFSLGAFSESEMFSSGGGDRRVGDGIVGFSWVLMVVVWLCM